MQNDLQSFGDSSFSNNKRSYKKTTKDVKEPGFCLLPRWTIFTSARQPSVTQLQENRHHFLRQHLWEQTALPSSLGLACECTNKERPLDSLYTNQVRGIGHVGLSPRDQAPTDRKHGQWPPDIFPPAFPSLFRPRVFLRGLPCTQKLSPHYSVQTRTTTFLSSMPGIGWNIALHASPTAKILSFLINACSRFIHLYFFLFKHKVVSVIKRISLVLETIVSFIYFILFLFTFTTVLSHWDFFHAKFGLPSSRKASCDRVVVPNLWCMLGVLVFRKSAEL